MKLLRTIALDPSDTFVFDVAAEPGDWAVSGTFRFYDRDPTGLTGKDRSAFRSGFLGVQSWGWSTLVQIVHATEDDRRMLVEFLAAQLVDHFGAPDLATACVAAEEEVAFVESLCTQPVSTLAVHRSAADGEVRESSADCNCGRERPWQSVLIHGGRGSRAGQRSRSCPFGLETRRP